MAWIGKSGEPSLKLDESRKKPSTEPPQRFLADDVIHVTIFSLYLADDVMHVAIFRCSIVCCCFCVEVAGKWREVEEQTTGQERCSSDGTRGRNCQILGHQQP